MTTVQFEKLVIEKTKDLPLEMLEEILDFIQFLREKNKNKFSKKITSTLNNLNKSQISHIDDEFANYKKLYPIE